VSPMLGRFRCERSTAPSPVWPARTPRVLPHRPPGQAFSVGPVACGAAGPGEERASALHGLGRRRRRGPEGDRLAWTRRRRRHLKEETGQPSTASADSVSAYPGMLVPGRPTRIERATSSTLGRVPDAVDRSLYTPAVKSRGLGWRTPMAGRFPSRFPMADGAMLHIERGCLRGADVHAWTSEPSRTRTTTIMARVS